MTDANVSRVNANMFRTAIICVALCITSCGRGPSQADLPAVAQPSLAGSSPIVRAQIERALDAVFEHPTHAKEDGALAMKLHACCHYEAAQAACQRNARMNVLVAVAHATALATLPGERTPDLLRRLARATGAASQGTEGSP